MKHLFIINPAAKKVKGKVELLKEEITDFFKAYPDIHYDVYTSAWCRDAVSYIRGFITEARKFDSETIRVHAVGGSGTLFEVVNGVIGLSNVEVAAYPYGRTNVFLRYFGQNNMKLFSSLETQIFDSCIPVDAIRSGYNYGICYGIIGLEALCAATGNKWLEKGLSADMSYIIASASIVTGEDNFTQHYQIEIDGKKYDNRYISIFIGNVPCYGNNFQPGVEAHPDDGKLEIYLHGVVKKSVIIGGTYTYLKGNYHKIKTISHYSGKRIVISSDKTICMNIDSKPFYGNSIEYEVIPEAIKFVCPKEIDIDSLPLLYNRPESGSRKGVIRSEQ